MMATEITLAELGSRLAEQFAGAALTADQKQRNLFVGLASEMSVPADEYRRIAVGKTPAERSAILDRAVAGILGDGAIGKGARVLPKRKNRERIGLDEAARTRLLAHFPDLKLTKSNSTRYRWTLDRELLDTSVAETVRQEGSAPDKSVIRKRIADILGTEAIGGGAKRIAPTKHNPEQIGIDDELKARLVARFPDLEIKRSHRPSHPWTVARSSLDKRLTRSLEEDALQRHRDGNALLKTGVPKAQLHRGTIAVKVILVDQADGTINAILANEETIRKHGTAAVSELALDLGMGTFPSFVPGGTWADEH